MAQIDPTLVLKSVLSFKREGGIALVDCDTADGGKVTLRFDIRYLWSVAADLRSASIDLVAPVPETLRAALGSNPDDAAADEDKQASASDAPDEEAVRPGFDGLEQAWGLCDALNDAHLAKPDQAPEQTFRDIAATHVLVPADYELISKETGFEVHLKNEFKLIYRPETKDWIPDRKDSVVEHEPEVI